MIKKKSQDKHEEGNRGDEQRIGDIEELANDICAACKTRHRCKNKAPCAMACTVAKSLYSDYSYRKIQDGAVVLTADELAEYETNYDKVYEQAKADIVGNMADGGTSCHWCMDAQYQRGRKDAATEIFSRLLKAVGDHGNGYIPTERDCVMRFVYLKDWLKDVSIGFGVEVKDDTLD